MYISSSKVYQYVGFFNKMKTTQYHLFIYGIFFCTSVFSQRGKDGGGLVNTANKIVNEYTTLTADAAAGATTITVASSTLNANTRFSAPLDTGDLILIIQAQGATILGQPDASVPTISSPNDATWGTITNYNNCGNYEWGQVASVPNATSIVLDCAF